MRVEAAAEPVEVAVPTENIVKQVASTGSATGCRGASTGCVTAMRGDAAAVVRPAATELVEVHQPPVEVAVPTENIVKQVTSTGSATGC
ncbi:MAG: hypothetical protein LBS86_00995 [Treponema sp.]|nr:hypothetical protein [Treponema sp.]